MEIQKFRVFNRTRGNFLSLEVSIVDTTVEPMKKLIEDLAQHAEVALWLKPYRGIPAAPGMPPFDIVYLDEDHRVVQEIESYPSPQVRPLNSRTASALVLPPHTVFGSQTLPGDELDVRAAQAADEAERRRGILSGPNGPGIAEQRTGSTAQESPQRVAATPAFPGDRSGQVHQAIQKLDEKVWDESQEEKKLSLKDRFLRWLNPDPSNRRWAYRHPLPGLVAYHWTGGAPKAYHIGDISDTGFFLLTEERPFPGTIVLMTLQRTNSDGENPEDSIPVRTKVVRWGADGVGLAFVLAKSPDKGGEIRPENGADQKALEKFLKQLNLPGHK